MSLGHRIAWLALLLSSGAGAVVPPAIPSAGILAKRMAPGWNLGNSLESTGAGRATGSRETAYGSPPVRYGLFRAVAAAGFKSVRIPVSWGQYQDADGQIAPWWLDRVAELVDAAQAEGLIVILNEHWDGGWLQPTQAAAPAATARLTAIWTQVATRFRGYDSRLLFAGTNEVVVKDDYGTPSAENCAAQAGFNQAFVDAVRATGGNNATRVLVVQGFNTNIDHSLLCNATLPRDPAAGALMMEVHYYDPYDFALNEKAERRSWGDAADRRHLDDQFAKVEHAFVDKGVPVVLGEYGAISRLDRDPAGTQRTEWDRATTAAARAHHLVPIYWDNGATGEHGMGLFDRATGRQACPDTVKAIVDAGR